MIEAKAQDQQAIAKTLGLEDPNEKQHFFKKKMGCGSFWQELSCP
jgi:hypothetical protein